MSDFIGMIWNTGIYSRAEIATARPVVTSIWRYSFAECLRVRRSDVSGLLTVVDYSDLYDFNHWSA